MNQPIQQAAFTQERRVALCPVHMLKQYVLRIASWCIADQLFVCFGPGKKDAPLSKQWLAHWVADSIVETYCATGCALPATVKCHSTRAVATSYAALGCVPLSEICAAATWASPCTFRRFYRLNVALPYFQKMFELISS